MAALTIRPTKDEHMLIQTAYELERAERLKNSRPIISMSRWMNKMLLKAVKVELGGNEK